MSPTTAEPGAYRSGSTGPARGEPSRRRLTLSPRWRRTLIGTLGLVTVVWLFFTPMLRLVALSFASEAGPTLAHYTEVLSEARTWRAIRHTAYVVGGGTLISIILGLGTAWLIAYTDIRGKRLMQPFILLPFILPSYIITIAWTEYLAPGSIPVRILSLIPFVDPDAITLYSLNGITAVMGLRHYAIVYLLTVGVLRRIPRELEQASHIAGAGGISTFRKVTLPMALPGIASGGLLAFLASLDNFGIPAILGIPAGIDVLSTLIYQEIVSFGPSAFARASTLSVLLGAIAVLGTLAQALLLRRSQVSETTHEDRVPRVALGRVRRGVEVLIWLTLVALSVVPLLSMAATSLVSGFGVPLTWDTLTFENYRFTLLSDSSTVQAIFNSVRLALAAAAIGLVIATPVAYVRTRRPSRSSKTMEMLIGLPYALPGIVVALAMIFTWLQPVPGVSWHPGVYGTAAILLIAYVVRFTFFQLRANVASFMQIDVSMEEAAHAGGASAVQTWRRVLLPLLVPGLLSGTALVLLTALTELTVSSILWSTGSETIGVAVYNFQKAGYTTYSTAVSTTVVILILLTMGAVARLVSLWSRRTGRRTP